LIQAEAEAFDTIFEKRLFLNPENSSGEWGLNVSNTGGEEARWFIGVQAENLVGASFRFYCESTEPDPRITVPWKTMTQDLDAAAMATKVPAGFTGRVTILYKRGNLRPCFKERKAIFRVVKY
jgi:hypothetical protein